MWLPMPRRQLISFLIEAEIHRPVRICKETSVDQRESELR
jgi:hypothetical protein